MLGLGPFACSFPVVQLCCHFYFSVLYTCCTIFSGGSVNALSPRIRQVGLVAASLMAHFFLLQELKSIWLSCQWQKTVFVAFSCVLEATSQVHGVGSRDRRPAWPGGVPRFTFHSFFCNRRVYWSYTDITSLICVSAIHSSFVERQPSCCGRNCIRCSRV